MQTTFGGMPTSVPAGDGGSGSGPGLSFNFDKKFYRKASDGKVKYSGFYSKETIKRNYTYPGKNKKEKTKITKNPITRERKGPTQGNIQISGSKQLGSTGIRIAGGVEINHSGALSARIEIGGTSEPYYKYKLDKPTPISQLEVLQDKHVQKVLQAVKQNIVDIDKVKVVGIGAVYCPSASASAQANGLDGSVGKNQPLSYGVNAEVTWTLARVVLLVDTSYITLDLAMGASVGYENNFTTSQKLFKKDAIGKFRQMKVSWGLIPVHMKANVSDTIPIEFENDDSIDSTSSSMYCDKNGLTYQYTHVNPFVREYIQEHGLLQKRLESMPYLGRETQTPIDHERLRREMNETRQGREQQEREQTAARRHAQQELQEYENFLSNMLNRYDISPYQCRSMEERGVFIDWYRESKRNPHGYDNFLTDVLNATTNPYDLDFVESFSQTERSMMFREWYGNIRSGSAAGSTHMFGSSKHQDQKTSRTSDLYHQQQQQSILNDIQDFLKSDNYKYGVECIDQLLTLVGAKRTKALRFGLHIARQLHITQIHGMKSVEGVYGMITAAGILFPEVEELLMKMHIDKIKMAYDLYEHMDDYLNMLNTPSSMSIGDITSIASTVLSFIPGIDPKLKAGIAVVANMYKLQQLLAMTSPPPMQVAYLMLSIIVSMMQLVESCSDGDGGGGGGGGDGPSKSGGSEPGTGTGPDDSSRPGDPSDPTMMEGESSEIAETTQQSSQGQSGSQEEESENDGLFGFLAETLRNPELSSNLKTLLKEAMNRYRKERERQRQQQQAAPGQGDGEDGGDMNDIPGFQAKTHRRQHHGLTRSAYGSRNRHLYQLTICFESLLGYASDLKSANEIIVNWQMIQHCLGIQRNVSEDSKVSISTCQHDGTKSSIDEEFGISSECKPYYSIQTGTNEPFDDDTFHNDFDPPKIRPFQSATPSHFARSSYSTDHASREAKKPGIVGKNYDTHLQHEMDVEGSFKAENGEIDDIKYGNQLDKITSMSRLGLVAYNTPGFQKLTKLQYIEQKLFMLAYTQEIEESREPKWLLITNYNVLEKRYEFDYRHLFDSYIRKNIVSLELKRELVTKQRSYINIIKNHPDGVRRCVIQQQQGESTEQEVYFANIKHKDYECYSTTFDWGIQLYPDVLKGNVYPHRHGNEAACKQTWEVGMGHADHDAFDHPRSTYKAKEYHEQCGWNNECTPECKQYRIRSYKCTCHIARMHDSCQEFSVCIDIGLPPDESIKTLENGCKSIAGLTNILTYIMYG